MRSQTFSTSEMSCEEKSTVLPLPFSHRISVRTSLMARGSRPVTGSSMTISSGSWIRAWARLARWSIPFEYALRRFSPACPSPTRSSMSFTFAVRTGEGMRERAAKRFRFSRPVIDLLRYAASGA